jgi:hypothetical protein
MYITKDKKNRNTLEPKGVNIYNKKLKEVYKKIQNEIKNIVITRLHTQIYKLIKDLQKLKKENTIIKNDLVYILKRILDNKSEFNTINNCSNNLISNSYINLNSNNNYSTINLNKSKNSILSIERNSTKNTINNFSKTKISLMSAPSTIDNYLNENNILIDQNTYHFDKNKFNNIDNRIDSYLNSLYRHNFVENHIGYENKYNLNNSKGIYDELFNTQNSILESKINHNSQKNIRISVDDKTEKGKSYSMKKIKNNSKYFNYRKKIDHFKLNLNKNEKNNLNISTNKKNKNKRKIINENKMNRNGNDSVSNNMTSGKKSNSKIKIIYTNRSPFLINKF